MKSFLFSLLIICTIQPVSAQENSLKTEYLNESSPEELEKRGRRFLVEENISDALICFKRSGEKYQLIDRTDKVGEMLMEQGYVYLDINDFDEAMSVFVEAREIYERTGNQRALSIVVLEIGELFSKLSQCENAHKNLKQTLTIQNQMKLKDDQLLIRTYMDLGINYGSCSDLDSALFYFKATLNLYQDTIETSYCGLLNNIGAIYSKKNDNIRALHYYNRALKLFVKIGNELGMAVSESNIAFIYKKEKRFEESIHLYIKAIDYFESVNSYIYLRDNLLNLSEVYEVIGDYKSALHYTNRYLEIDDKVSNSEVISRMNDLQMQHDIRKKENELKILEKQNEVTRIRLYMLIGGFVMLVIIALLIYRTMRVNLRNTNLKQEMLRHEKNQLNKDIEIKNKELEIFAMKVIEKNEFLEKLKSDIKGISSGNGETFSRLKEISAVIHSNLNAEKDRREFELKLDKAHQSFFAKLQNLNLDLTEYEKRLCSLLVLELKTKDIAVILNISPDSVKKSRYRLRKRLNLDTDENLVHYLMNL